MPGVWSGATLFSSRLWPHTSPGTSTPPHEWSGTTCCIGFAGGSEGRVCCCSSPDCSEAHPVSPAGSAQEASRRPWISRLRSTGNATMKRGDACRRLRSNCGHAVRGRDRMGTDRSPDLAGPGLARAESSPRPAPEVRIESIDWGAEPGVGLPDSRPGTDPCPCGKASAGDGVFESGRFLHQFAEIHGRIEPFDGNFRHALEQVGALADSPAPPFPAQPEWRCFPCRWTSPQERVCGVMREPGRLPRKRHSRCACGGILPVRPRWATRQLASAARSRSRAARRPPEQPSGGRNGTRRLEGVPCCPGPLRACARGSASMFGGASHYRSAEESRLEASVPRSSREQRQVPLHGRGGTPDRSLDTSLPGPGGSGHRRVGGAPRLGGIVALSVPPPGPARAPLRAGNSGAAPGGTSRAQRHVRGPPFGHGASPRTASRRGSASTRRPHRG